jgi:hypothetical protein
MSDTLPCVLLSVHWPEKLTVAMLVSNRTQCNGTRRFIAAPTTAGHWILARQNPSSLHILCHSLSSTLMLSSHRRLRHRISAFCFGFVKAITCCIYHLHALYTTRKSVLIVTNCLAVSIVVLALVKSYPNSFVSAGSGYSSRP